MSFAEHLRRELAKPYRPGQTKAERLVENLVTLALRDDVAALPAITQIALRLDGPPVAPDALALQEAALALKEVAQAQEAQRQVWLQQVALLHERRGSPLAQTLALMATLGLPLPGSPGEPGASAGQALAGSTVPVNGHVVNGSNGTINANMTGAGTSP